jgi:hypothetical protein
VWSLVCFVMDMNSRKVPGPQSTFPGPRRYPNCARQPKNAKDASFTGTLRRRFSVKDHPAPAFLRPSAILRAPDPEQRRAAYDDFVKDLTAIRQILRSAAGAH